MKFLAFCWLLPAYPLLLHCSKSSSPVKDGLLSAALGLSGLTAACILSPITGMPVSINFFTTAIAVFTGLPGVAGMMLCALPG